MLLSFASVLLSEEKFRQRLTNNIMNLDAFLFPLSFITTEYISLYRQTSLTLLLIVEIYTTNTLG